MVLRQAVSAPDLTIVSEELIQGSAWAVGPDLNSDHFPVVFSFPPATGKGTIGVLANRWVYAAADWPGFTDSLDNNWPSADLGSVEANADLFSARIVAAAQDAIPRRRLGSEPNRRCPWWSPDCDAMKVRRDRFRRIWARSPSTFARVSYNCAVAGFRRAVKRSKRQSWSQYWSSVHTSMSPAESWAALRRMSDRRRTPMVPLLCDAHKLLQPPDESCALFRTFYESASVAPPDIPVAHWTADPAGSSMDDPFTMDELDLTISALRNGAPGEDGITVPMLRHMGPDAKRFLLDVFNRSWTCGDIPRVWRVGIIVPIRKPGKDPTTADNFRPITLLSVVGKVLERLVLRRVQWWLGNRAWWEASQHGGLRGKSVMSAIGALVRPIQEAILCGDVMAVEFLDLSKAYDQVHPMAILNALRNAGVAPGAFRWLQAFLAARQAKVRVGTTLSEPFWIHRGVPQGSALSPTLFSMATNDLGSYLPDFLSAQYIDDTAVGSRASTVAAAIEGIREANAILPEWSRSKGLSFHAAKSVIVVFARRARLPCNEEVMLDGAEVPFSSSVRYLGVTLDSGMSWAPHVGKLRASLARRHCFLRAISGRTWGANTGAMRLVYSAVVQPLIDFGAAFYGTASAKVLRGLDSDIHRGLRMMTGLPRSTFLPALYVEAEVLPPSLRREFQMLSVTACSLHGYPLTAPTARLAKARDYGRVALRPMVTRVCRFSTWGALSECTLLTGSYPSLPPWRSGPLRRILSPAYVKGDTSPFNELLFSSWLEANGSPIPIFTDASVGEDGHVAAGFWAPVTETLRVYELPRGVSVFTAEVVAISLAAAWLSSLGPLQQTVILSDSLSAVSWLSTGESAPTETLRTRVWQDLRSSFPGGSPVDIAWVPSHSGVVGNEVIDFAVSRVRPQVFFRPVLPARDLRAIARKSVSQVWQRSWRMNCSALNKIRRDVTSRVRATLPSRAWETVFARARVDRLPTRVNRCKWGQIDEPECRTCGRLDTIDHRLVLCPRAGEVRSRLKARFPELQNDKELLMSVMLGVGPLAERIPMSIYRMVYEVLRRM